MLKKVSLIITAVIFSLVSMAGPADNEQDSSLAISDESEKINSSEDVGSNNPEIQIAIGTPEEIKGTLIESGESIEISQLEMQYSPDENDWKLRTKEALVLSFDKLKSFLDYASHYSTKVVCVLIRAAMAYESAHLLMIHSNIQYVPSAAFSYEYTAMIGSALFGLFNGTFYKLGKKYGFSFFLGTELLYTLAYTAVLQVTQYLYTPDIYTMAFIAKIVFTMLSGLIVGFFGQTQFDRFISEWVALNQSIINSWRDKSKKYKHSRHLVVQNKALIMSLLGSVFFNSATIYMSNPNSPSILVYAGIAVTGAIAYKFAVKVERRHKALWQKYENEHNTRNKVKKRLKLISSDTNNNQTQLCSNLFGGFPKSVSSF